ncbi:GNAT family N-acetyltransferase [Micromonospora sp. NPDC005171]|uniref:GNAT family N-acetyltransferase n=1 Tax=Micromonospora sp. NPDC005171 TaxID=3156866 RepID=UPI0033AC1092
MADNAEDMITLTNAEQDSGGSSPSVATPSGAEDFVITNDSARGIYEATIGGQTAAGLVYTKIGSRVVLSATSVFPEFRGKGLASRLIGGILDELRRQGRTATVTCPFAAAFVNAHPEYADVVDPTSPRSHPAGRRH